MQFSDPHVVNTSCGTHTNVYTLLTAPLVHMNPATGSFGPTNDWSSLADPKATFPAPETQWHSPTVGCPSGSPPGCPTGYPQLRTRVQDELLANPDRYPMLLPWYGHEFEPLTNPDPLLVIREMPDCTGLAYSVCLAAIQDAGFGVITSQERTFETATPLPQAQAAEVLSTSPTAGTMHNVENEVIIDHNPLLDVDMPRLVPLPLAASESLSGQGETAAEYEVRLGALDLTMGAPEVLSDTTLDPEFGPDAVVDASPQPGSRAHHGDSVAPRTNPPTAPQVGAGGGCDPWVSPSLNFAPLQGLGVISVFPFAVPFWVFDALDEWVGSPVTPAWDFHFPFAGEGENWHVDLAMFDPYMPQIRIVLLAASLIAMAWFFLSLAMGAPSNRAGSES